MPRQHKYRAVRTYVGSIPFASKREACRYGHLALLQRAGKIKALELQPRYALHAPSGEVIGHYVADFKYDENGVTVIEDVKSGPTKTTIYRWKKKHLRLEYGIEVRET